VEKPCANVENYKPNKNRTNIVNITSKM